MFENINVAELKKINNLNLIDIRSRGKYNQSHISNAVNIIVEELLLRPEKYLKMSEKYYIYCSKGMQSRNLCQILARKGYKVVNVVGGYEAWVLNE